MLVGPICAPRLDGRPTISAASCMTRCTSKLLALPDSSLVYPAHGAGSLCGKALSKETVSTIGEQRKTNYALQPLTKEAFIELVTADQPDAPSYFTYDAVLNSRKRQTLERGAQLGTATDLARRLPRASAARYSTARHARRQRVCGRAPEGFNQRRAERARTRRGPAASSTANVRSSSRQTPGANESLPSALAESVSTM